MLTFERLRTVKNSNFLHRYKPVARNQERFIIAAHMDIKIAMDLALFCDMMEWLCSENVTGEVVLPLFLYSVWEKAENGIISEVLAEDNFFVPFTNLRDAMSYKLMYGDFLLGLGVFQECTGEDRFEHDLFMPISKVSDILKYRPNADIPVDLNT